MSVFFLHFFKILYMKNNFRKILHICIGNKKNDELQHKKEKVNESV